MKCQNCGIEDATVKYYESINGIQKEIMICNKCVKDLNLLNYPNMLSYFFTTYPKEEIENEFTNKVCSKCSYTFDDYLKKGLFGCANCYTEFSDRVDTLLTKIHGKNRHLKFAGKAKENNENKSRSTVKQVEESLDIEEIKDIKVLKNLLTLSIKEERYEESAKIRDRIKELEK